MINARVDILVSFLSLWLVIPIFAGARGGDLAIVDATIGIHSKTSARLFELFTKDAREVFQLGEKAGMEWIGEETVVKLVPRADFVGVTEPMLVIKDKEAVVGLQEKLEIQDGLIVFQYDEKAQKVRLKLFDGFGNERILVKLPLCEEGPMAKSVMKSTRRGALIAIGASVEFNP